MLVDSDKITSLAVGISELKLRFGDARPVKLSEDFNKFLRIHKIALKKKDKLSNLDKERIISMFNIIEIAFKKLYDEQQAN